MAENQSSNIAEYGGHDFPGLTSKVMVCQEKETMTDSLRKFAIKSRAQNRAPKTISNDTRETPQSRCTAHPRY